jgi:hypothetical protein
VKVYVTEFSRTHKTTTTQRPNVPILALCPFKETARQLVLSWGVYPDLPKAGSYGYDVSEDGKWMKLWLRCSIVHASLDSYIPVLLPPDMFDYDAREYIRSWWSDLPSLYAN